MKISFLGRSLILIASVAASTGMLIISLGSRIKPNLITVAENLGKKEIVEMIQEVVSDHSYEDAEILSREENETRYNTKYLNELLLSTTKGINKKLQSELLYQGNGTSLAFRYKVPLGLSFNNPLLVNFGPSIPVLFKLIGDFSSNLVSSVESFGINNALIKISLKIDFKTELILPLTSSPSSFTYEAPLSLSIIKGDIPFNLSQGEINGVYKITGSYSSI